MTLNPVKYHAMPVEMFDVFTNWQTHDGAGQPVPDTTLVKVMYSNGFVSNMVRVAYAWRHWTGGRDWWLKPADDRLYIVAYVVI